MVFTLYQALLLSNTRHAWLLALLLWILSSKVVKVAPYFAKHPRDLVHLPGYILFGYFHSLIKLYALLTVWNTSWSGRELDVMARMAARLSFNGPEDDGRNDHAQSRPQRRSFLKFISRSISDEVSKIMGISQRAARTP